MRKNLITVYIPTHNRSKLLKRAIESVLSQEYHLIELIVIDDGSKDDTQKILDNYTNDSRVLLLRNETPMGACYCRNMAIENSSGEFITGLDDDDYFIPGRLGNLINFWQNLSEAQEKFSGVFTSAIKIEKNRAGIVNTEKVASAEKIITENIVGSQIFTKREYLLAINGFRTDLQAWQDWDTWVRIVRKFGPLINYGTPSYVIDESHEYFRISNKPESTIRNVFENFCSHNGPINKIQRSKILLSLRSYQQVKFSKKDYARLIYLVFDPKYLVKKIIKKLFNNY